MEYSRHVIRIKDQNEYHEVLQTISGMQALVVVNIAGSAETKPVIFSEENLRALLAGGPESLFVEALPLREYQKVMADKIGQVIRSALSLRAMLRVQYAADLEVQAGDFGALLAQTLLLLNCCATQGSRPGVAENFRKLQSCLGQFTASVRDGDNVRCMDDLQYEILPTLKKVLKLFGK